MTLVKEFIEGGLKVNGIGESECASLSPISCFGCEKWVQKIRYEEQNPGEVFFFGFVLALFRSNQQQFGVEDHFLFLINSFVIRGPHFLEGEPITPWLSQGSIIKVVKRKTTCF